MEWVAKGLVHEVPDLAVVVKEVEGHGSFLEGGVDLAVHGAQVLEAGGASDVRQQNPHVEQLVCREWGE